ncbi:hypothetical protein DPMN_015226 [Dreissena polymorpha]|uniref:Uncharacterized protein n=1 Tax=Dreissena polymorpha TaxID=45954 RepID=A0A9D4S5Z6_DREPO|nr:hypothetical protein DPMN_015226 [Dreissena polymorpha]
MPRRTVARFQARLQLFPSATTSGNPYPIEETPNVSEDAPPAGASPDSLMGLLQTFLSKRHNITHPANAFGYYVDGSLRNLPPAMGRKAEARNIGTLHE